MPTYDYQCSACEHAFEAFHSITAQPLKKCPSCGKNKLRRLIGTGAALLFKGDGFYITDYRSESYKQAAKAESGAADKTAAGTPDKAATGAAADAKPKAEPKPAAAAPASHKKHPKKK